MNAFDSARMLAPLRAAIARPPVFCTPIVIGTRVLGAVSSFVLGSVSMKVVQLAAIPVTLVK